MINFSLFLIFILKSLIDQKVKQTLYGDLDEYDLVKWAIILNLVGIDEILYTRWLLLEGSSRVTITNAE